MTMHNIGITKQKNLDNYSNSNMFRYLPSNTSHRNAHILKSRAEYLRPFGIRYTAVSTYAVVALLQQLSELPCHILF